jgi:hypothetical protein
MYIARAIDLDEGKNGEVKYLINSKSIVPFVIDQYSGSISVSASNLDREVKSLYIFDVVALDSGTPSLNSTVKIHISLVDYNDNPSRFSQAVYSASGNTFFSVKEINTVILTNIIVNFYY